MSAIRVTKHGEPVLTIHPDALEQHLRKGWEVVETAEEQQDDETPVPDAPRRRGRPPNPRE